MQLTNNVCKWWMYADERHTLIHAHPLMLALNSYVQMTNNAWEWWTYAGDECMQVMNVGEWCMYASNEWFVTVRKTFITGIHDSSLYYIYNIHGSFCYITYTVTNDVCKWWMYASDDTHLQIGKGITLHAETWIRKKHHLQFGRDATRIWRYELGRDIKTHINMN